MTKTLRDLTFVSIFCPNGHDRSKALGLLRQPLAAIMATKNDTNYYRNLQDFATF